MEASTSNFHILLEFSPSTQVKPTSASGEVCFCLSRNITSIYLVIGSEKENLVATFSRSIGCIELEFWRNSVRVSLCCNPPEPCGVKLQWERVLIQEESRNLAFKRPMQSRDNFPLAWVIVTNQEDCLFPQHSVAALPTHPVAGDPPPHPSRHRGLAGEC